MLTTLGQLKVGDKFKFFKDDDYVHTVIEIGEGKVACCEGWKWPAGKEVTVDTDPFDEILDEMRETHSKKQKDYGTGDDPYANVRASEEFGIPPWAGAAIRANDKLVRIKSFLKNGNLVNESIEDAFLDLAVYGIIGLVLYRESVK